MAKEYHCSYQTFRKWAEAHDYLLISYESDGGVDYALWLSPQGGFIFMSVEKKTHGIKEVKSVD